MRLNLLILVLNCCLAQYVWATPQHLNTTLDSIVGEVDYVDYLPRYRSLNNDFIISKIEFSEEKTILHFRYVAVKDKDAIRFYGASKDLTWKLATSVRATPTSISKPSTIVNVRINDEPQKALLGANDEEFYEPMRGDVITCEIHFDNMPNQVRSVHLLGGDIDKQGNERFVCNDIMIKSKESRMLGNSEQMKANIKRFYGNLGKVRYPDIVDATTLEQDKKNKENKQRRAEQSTVSPIQGALEPIDYMPKTLNSISDIECSERLILKNVYFDDGKSEYSGRVKAIRTMAMVAEYLKNVPGSKIVLHGHTDIFGNAFRNLELSRQRVLTVKRTLEAKGIVRGRIITMHHGGSQPLPRYKDGGALNRRVEMEIVCPSNGKQVKTSSTVHK
ncbi:MAG: OmpA family protein [Aureispira sp.]|nr:OmpA family protein [Aureispira sp.]